MNMINLNSFIAPNDEENITPAHASEVLAVLSGFGMMFDTVMVQQGSNAAGPEDEISFAALSKMTAHAPNDQGYLIIGRYNSDADQKAYLLAKDRSMMFTPQADDAPDKPVDGLNSFIALYVDRHSGTTRAQAESAAVDLPTVQLVVKAELDAIRAFVK